MFVGVAAAILLSKFLFPSRKPGLIFELLDAFAVLLILSGFLFRIAARGYKEEHSSNGNALVKDGPYAVIRNPMYFGTFLIGAGIILLIFRLWVLLLFSVVYLMIYIPQTRKEEVVLSEMFGGDYRDYCRATPKYFPRLYNLPVIFNPAQIKFFWLKKELPSLIAVAAIAMGIKIFQEVKTSGYREILEEPLKLSLVVVLFLLIFSLCRRGKKITPFKSNMFF